MKVLIRGENLKITDAMQEHAILKLEKLEKYLKGEDFTANILVKVRNHLDKVEITIPLKHFVLRAEEEQETFYAAIDVVVDKLERQIRKNKAKLSSKSEKIEKDFVPTEILEITKEEVKDAAIVKRKELDLKPMSEEEAVLQMELLNHEFFIFKNDVDNQISVLYKRKDGNYGIIDTK